MKKSYIIAAIAILLLIIAFFSFTFTINEAEQVIITRFGEIRKVIVPESNYETIVNELKTDERFKNVSVQKGRGIFFKTPFIDTVVTYSSMLFTYDTAPREVITYDKKNLILDNTAQWQIVNPALFMLGVGLAGNPNSRIDDILYSKLNEKVGQVEAHVLISDKVYTENLLNQITSESNEIVSSFGIRINHVRIKKTDFPQENYDNIFNRMRTEREQKAKQYRSEGQEEAIKIKSQADLEAKKIEAEAITKAATVKGEGDAEAARIYNEAYSKDMEFYNFYRSMQAYKKAFSNGETTIIFDKNSPFLKYIFGP